MGITIPRKNGSGNPVSRKVSVFFFREFSDCLAKAINALNDKLLCALLLLSLEGRIVLYGQLKCKAVLPKCFVNYRQVFFKLSFTLNYALKRAND